MSIKLSLDQANELFQKIGVDVAVVADSESADQKPDLENISKGVFNEMETKIKHDVELEVKDQARKEEAGKQLGTLRRALKRSFGIDDKEVAEMNIDDMLKLAKEKVSANKSDADNDLMKRYEDLRAEKDSEIELLRSQHEKEKSDWDEKYQMRDIEERVIGLVNSIPRVGGDPLAQAKAIVNNLKSNYITKVNSETKEIELYDKNNPEKKVFDGKNLVTDKYYAEKYLKDLGIYATDTRNVIPKDVKEGQQTTVAPGVATLDETDPMKFLESTFV